MSEGYCVYCTKFPKCIKKNTIHDNWHKPSCYDDKSDPDGEDFWI